MKSIQYALALSAAIAVGSLALSVTPAAAANSAMADCNKKWNDEKAANATNGATYQDFLKGCLKSAGASTDAKPTDTKAADTKAADTKAKSDTMTAKTTTDTKPKTIATTAPAMADTATDPEAANKKACGKEWKALKDAGNQGTQKKKDFVAECLTKMDAADKTKPKTTVATVAPATAVVAPAKTVVAPAKTVDAGETAVPPDPTDANAKPAMTDAKGKPRTPGQLAMDKRIKECGVMWKEAKAAGTTGGLKWPQYWSQCNKKLKAAAQ